jgi:hypothetical protein
VTATHQVGQTGVAKRVGGDGHVCLLTQAAQREVDGACLVFSPRESRL